VRRALLVIAAVKIGAIGAYAAVGRGIQLRWGATPEECSRPLPGDDPLPVADLVATRAITIPAAPATVWPWIAQMGQGRGGFYSYDRLENVFGCEVHSADRIVPEWQQVAVGDPFRLHPQVTLRVSVVDPPHALVIEGIAPDAPGASGEPEVPYDFTWAFVLAPDGPSATRLLVRERYRYRTRWTPLLVEVLSVASFTMSQRMMRGIRERVARG
jgi:hypothetical protein